MRAYRHLWFAVLAITGTETTTKYSLGWMWQEFVTWLCKVALQPGIGPLSLTLRKTLNPTLTLSLTFAFLRFAFRATALTFRPAHWVCAETLRVGGWLRHCRELMALSVQDTTAELMV